jgi:hypothetical protein
MPAGFNGLTERFMQSGCPCCLQLPGLEHEKRAYRGEAFSGSGQVGSPIGLAGVILVVMKPARAASRRFLPTSPFGPPTAAPPIEQFAERDQVVHDTYGLGRVIGVEADTALAVDFGSCRVRIVLPCAKLTKL